jgi:hypothetical protein
MEGLATITVKGMVVGKLGGIDRGQLRNSEPTEVWHAVFRAHAKECAHDSKTLTNFMVGIPIEMTSL